MFSSELRSNLGLGNRVYSKTTYAKVAHGALIDTLQALKKQPSLRASTGRATVSSSDSMDKSNARLEALRIGTADLARLVDRYAWLARWLPLPGNICKDGVSGRWCQRG